jgi:CheY-like chemotaxis protein
MIKRFFLIDDDADDVELFMEALAETSPSDVCYHAIDGQEALDKLNNHEIDPPDIIFLDINMPGMNGWQCLRLLKSSDTYKDIPVVMYSTSSTKRDKDIALNLGAQSFLTKPADYQDLKKLLMLLTQSSIDNFLKKMNN